MHLLLQSLRIRLWMLVSFVFKEMLSPLLASLVVLVLETGLLVLRGLHIPDAVEIADLASSLFKITLWGPSTVFNLLKLLTPFATFPEEKTSLFDPLKDQYANDYYY